MGIGAKASPAGALDAGRGWRILLALTSALVPDFSDHIVVTFARPGNTTIFVYALSVEVIAMDSATSKPLKSAESEPPAPQAETDPRISKTSAATVDPSTPPFSPTSATPVLEKDLDDLEFTGNVEVDDHVPSEKDIARVADLFVLDAQGQSRKFKEIYAGEGVAPRQLVIFIRHFFCGVSTSALLLETPDS